MLTHSVAAFLASASVLYFSSDPEKKAGPTFRLVFLLKIVTQYTIILPLSKELQEFSSFAIFQPSQYTGLDGHPWYKDAFDNDDTDAP
jgi:hypothetical protein